MQNDSGRAQFQGDPTEATTSVASTRGGAAEFFGDRLRTSMTRATVEDSRAALGQTLRRGAVHEFIGTQAAEGIQLGA